MISKVVFGSGGAGDSPDSILSLDLFLYLQASIDNGLGHLCIWLSQEVAKVSLAFDRTVSTPGRELHRAIFVVFSNL